MGANCRDGLSASLLSTPRGLRPSSSSTTPEKYSSSNSVYILPTPDPRRKWNAFSFSLPISASFFYSRRRTTTAPQQNPSRRAMLICSNWNFAASKSEFSCVESNATNLYCRVPVASDRLTNCNYARPGRGCLRDEGRTSLSSPLRPTVGRGGNCG